MMKQIEIDLAEEKRLEAVREKEQRVKVEGLVRL